MPIPLATAFFLMAFLMVAVGAPIAAAIFGAAGLVLQGAAFVLDAVERPNDGPR